MLTTIAGKWGGLVPLRAPKDSKRSKLVCGRMLHASFKLRLSYMLLYYDIWGENLPLGTDLFQCVCTLNVLCRLGSDSNCLNNGKGKGNIIVKDRLMDPWPWAAVERGPKVPCRQGVSTRYCTSACWFSKHSEKIGLSFWVNYFFLYSTT